MQSQSLSSAILASFGRYFKLVAPVTKAKVLSVTDAVERAMETIEQYRPRAVSDQGMEYQHKRMAAFARRVETWLDSRPQPVSGSGPSPAL